MRQEKQALGLIIGLTFLCLLFVLITAAQVGNSGRVFYAARVIDQTNVNNPEYILGEPDGKLAEIKPGGEITVLMSEQIVYHTASDDGYLVVQGEAAYGLAGLFRLDAEGRIAWQPLAPGSNKNGFKLGFDQFQSFQRTSAIKIVNDDSRRSLLVDAVAGFRSDDK